MRLFYMLLFLLFFSFALTKERNDACDAYEQSIPKKSDSNNQLYKRLAVCLSYHRSIIKWRRSFIYAFLATVCIFTFIHFRFPNGSEMILYISILYIIYLYMWNDYDYRISNQVETIGFDIIKMICK